MDSPFLGMPPFTRKVSKPCQVKTCRHLAGKNSALSSEAADTNQKLKQFQDPRVGHETIVVGVWQTVTAVGLWLIRSSARSGWHRRHLSSPKIAAGTGANCKWRELGTAIGWTTSDESGATAQGVARSPAPFDPRSSCSSCRRNSRNFSCWYAQQALKRQQQQNQAQVASPARKPAHG